MERRRGSVAEACGGSTGTLTLAAVDDLVGRAQRGEGDAFAGLFKTYNRRIYCLCLRMTGSPAQAEDLTQEVFLKLFRKISTFRGQAAFSTWLHRLAVNEVLMHLRKKRLDEVSLEGLEAWREGSIKQEHGNHDPNLTGTVDRLILNRAFAKLPLGYRSALLLHDVQGYEHSEIARIMKWSPGNSKSQLHRARQRLRDLLRRQGRRAAPVERRVESEAKKRFPLGDRGRDRRVNRLEPAFRFHQTSVPAELTYILRAHPRSDGGVQKVLGYRAAAAIHAGQP
jgi:RNA polymerase sigma-70 factor (ECF subfamily)